MIAGYALIEVKSKEEAIDVTKRFLKVAGDGESEIGQVMEPEDAAREQAWRDEPQKKAARRW